MQTSLYMESIIIINGLNDCRVLSTKTTVITVSLKFVAQHYRMGYQMESFFATFGKEK